MGLEPTGRRMRIDEVYFFRIADDRITALWGDAPAPGSS
jgi:predicted ester cyclase